jgi:hypothetical protein
MEAQLKYKTAPTTFVSDADLESQRHKRNTGDTVCNTGDKRRKKI